MAPYHILIVIISSVIPENLVLLTKSEQSGPKSAHIRPTICTKLSKWWPNTSYFSSVIRVSSTTISDRLRFSHLQFLNGTHYHKLCAVQPPTQSFDGLSNLKFHWILTLATIIQLIIVLYHIYPAWEIDTVIN